MSFRLKTILGIVLIELTLLLALILMILNFVEKSQNREIFERADTTINLFISAAKEPFLASDLAKLESLTLEILENPSIAYVKVLDFDDSVISMAGDQQILNKPFEKDTTLKQAMQDGILDISHEINIDGSVLGTVQIGISTESVIKDANIIKNYGLSIAGIEILIVTLLSFALGTWLTRHLITLKNAAEKIENGIYGERVDIQGNDEIALTAKSFNSMSHRLMETERLRLETLQRLEIAERHSRLLLNSAGEGIFGINSEHIISFANPEAARLLGYGTSTQLTDLDVREVFKDNPSVLQHCYQCLQDGKQIQADDESLYLKNLPPLKIEYSCSPILNESSTSGAVFIFSDISKRKEAEAAITKAHYIALENAQAKADFMANISHELRTPMHGIMGLLQLIDKTAITDEYAEYITVAQQSADKLHHLIDDILDFSNFDSGKAELSNIDFEIEETLTECIKHNATRAEEKGLALNLDFSSYIKWLKGDPQRLMKIINHLIDNAIKFTASGSITLYAFFIEKNDQKIKFEFHIKDTGIGIQKSQQSKLFNPFHQVDSSLTRQHGGAGLGLAICKSLVEMMEGKIRVESERDHGSEFIFNALFNISSIQHSQDFTNDSLSKKL